MPSFTVMVDDNFHYMEEDERRTFGSFDTLEEAVAACRGLVDRWLAENHKPGMSAAELYSLYTSFGEDPFILGGAEAEQKFSAWDYAKQRAEAMCR